MGGGPPEETPRAAPRKTTVLLTGCSEGGIGFALAQEYHRRGCRVIATARSPAKMQALKQEPASDDDDDDLMLLQLDVTDATSIAAAVEAVTNATGGQLDIVVNNAGGGYQAPLLDADLDQGRRLFEVNVWGVLAVTQAFAPLLVASASAGRRPRVVNIGSIVGFKPAPWQGVYNASKGALASLNDAMRLELRPLGVDVVHVVTGGIATRFFDHAAATVLPAGSLYAPIAADIRDNVAGARAREALGCPVDVYARTVVARTLKSSPPASIWKGSLATLIWLGVRFAWDGITDKIIEWMWGMGPLRARFRAATANKQL